jgi:hypothetical protein
VGSRDKGQPGGGGNGIASCTTTSWLSRLFLVIYEGRLFLERSENLPASLSREACPLEEGKGWGFSDSTRNPAESFSRPVYLACRQFSNQSIRAGPCPPTLNNPPAPLLREVLRVRTNVDFPTPGGEIDVEYHVLLGRFPVVARPISCSGLGVFYSLKSTILWLLIF